MRRVSRWSFCAVLISIAAIPGHAFAGDIKVESKIKSATVYSDRATVTRTASVEIPAGAHNLVFSGLPIKLYENSFRVEGTAQAAVIFGAISSKVENTEDIVVEGVRALTDQRLQIVDRLGILMAEKKARIEANEFLKIWAKQAGTRKNDDAAPLELDYEKWLAASDGLSAKILENTKTQLALERKIMEEQKKLYKVDADIEQHMADQKQSYMVTVPFESDKPATLNVSLSYQIADVGWAPTYDARLDVGKKTLDLIQYGSVSQRTGEEWEDIELTLSTAQPSRGASLPKIYPIWLSLMQKHVLPMASMVSSPPGTAEAAPAYVAAVEEKDEVQIETEGPLHRWRRLQDERVVRSAGQDEEDPFAFEDDTGLESFQKTATELEYEYGLVLGDNEAIKRKLKEFKRDQSPKHAQTRQVSASITTGGIVGEYKVTGPATVKADGTLARLQIAELKNEPNLLLQIKPQVSTDAYMLARFTLKGDAPVLPGAVSLFRDGAFIGQGAINEIIRPEEESEISFGIDDAVKIKRDVLKNESSQTGLIAMSRVIERNFVTGIENYHKQDIDIEVLEMVPVSKDKRIVIEMIGDKTTPGYETDYKKVKGATRWTSTMKPGQKSEIKLGWKISWPKDETLNGLR
ncbi:MAG: mucoidy inhibitor MuiA family protein [Alphaproteobacteria bacterium]|nr:mucoidy inhibitor MuiA family protein [Alphaproteobacteria bacterium]MCB9974388.1 mucoidy inhibitor MuiA family protein [Rhodospirillales bacterium]